VLQKVPAEALNVRVREHKASSEPTGLEILHIERDPGVPFVTVQNGTISHPDSSTRFLEKIGSPEGDGALSGSTRTEVEPEVILFDKIGILGKDTLRKEEGARMPHTERRESPEVLDEPRVYLGGGEFLVEEERGFQGGKIVPRKEKLLYGTAKLMKMSDGNSDTRCLMMSTDMPPGRACPQCLDQVHFRDTASTPPGLIPFDFEKDGGAIEALGNPPRNDPDDSRMPVRARKEKDRALPQVARPFENEENLFEDLVLCSLTLAIQGIKPPGKGSGSLFLFAEEEFQSKASILDPSRSVETRGQIKGDRLLVHLPSPNPAYLHEGADPCVAPLRRKVIEEPQPLTNNEAVCAFERNKIRKGPEGCQSDRFAEVRFLPPLEKTPHSQSSPELDGKRQGNPSSACKRPLPGIAESGVNNGSCRGKRLSIQVMVVCHNHLHPQLIRLLNLTDCRDPVVECEKNFDP
jgi:hypothetical protein